MNIKDPYIVALKYAEKHPEGFTLGELCQNSSINETLCKRMKSEFVHSGIFTQTNEQKDDCWGTEQHVYILSFAGKSQLLSHRILILTWVLAFLTIVLVIGLGVQINMQKIQTGPVQAEQAFHLRNIIEECNQEWMNEDELTRWIDSKGRKMSCKEVLDKYFKNQN